MMNHPSFQLSKVKRLIAVSGQEFSFERPGVNDFNEPTDTAETVVIKGVYHETSSFVTLSTSEASISKAKPSPQILALYSDASKLKMGDKLNYHNQLYKVTGWKDLMESGIVADISLEVIQDGKRI